MAKKQTRRSISVSRTTYERLKAFCETNHISMSQLVETRVNDFLGPGETMRPELSAMTAIGAMTGGAVTAAGAGAMAMSAPRPSPMTSSLSASAMAPVAPRAPLPSRPVEARPTAAPAPAPGSAVATAPVAPPMTSAAARFAVDPPPPIIKPRQETAAPKPAEKRPDQIFTF